MDPSAFLEVEYGAEEGPLTDLTEDDIVLLDDEPEFEEPGLSNDIMMFFIVIRKIISASVGSKRPPPSLGVPPPLKKIKAAAANSNSPGGGAKKVTMNSKFTPRGPHAPAPHLASGNRAKVASPAAPAKATAAAAPQLTVTKRPGPTPASAPAPARPKLPTQSITWKYRALGENQYTADIRKAEMLRDYEPEQCVCRRPPPGEEEDGSTPCGSGCINR